jgi:hypothetical protein
MGVPPEIASRLLQLAGPRLVHFEGEQPPGGRQRSPIAGPSGCCCAVCGTVIVTGPNRPVEPA